MVNETSSALQPQQQQPVVQQHEAPVSGPLEAFEALAWCEQQAARITFQRVEDGRTTCTIEMLAPGSTWNLLRARGSDFLSAIGAARAQWVALGRAGGIGTPLGQVKGVA